MQHDPILEAIPDGILLVDLDGVIRFVNEAATRLSGYSREELIGSPVDRLVPDAERKAHEPLRRAFQETGHARPMGTGLDISMERKDGLLVPVDIALGRMGDLVVTAVRDATEIRIADSLARQARERIARVEERERIARDLHDGVIQSLFAVGLGLGAARSSDPTRSTEIVDKAIDSIDDVIRDLRDYIFGLGPTRAADQGFAAILKQMVESMRTDRTADISLEVDEWVAEVAASRAGALLQATREAISNAVRHASAQTVRVRVRAEGNTGILEIIDDGCGFDPEAALGTGHGLVNLQARAKNAGGTVAVESAPGRGTTVRLRFPL